LEPCGAELDAYDADLNAYDTEPNAYNFFGRRDAPKRIPPGSPHRRAESL